MIIKPINPIISDQKLFKTSSPTFAGLTITGGTVYFWGDESTEGSVRLKAENGSLKVQIRSATQWETPIGWSL